MTADKANIKEKDGKKSAKKPVFATRFLIVSLMMMALVFFPSTLVIGVCLIPTFVAVVIDNYRPKTAWITVGAMNFTSMLPTWFTLWERGHRLDTAIELVTSPSVLMIAYSGAAVGWLIYLYITPLIAGFVVSKNKRRLKDIEKRLQVLLTEWGEEVTK